MVKKKLENRSTKLQIPVFGNSWLVNDPMRSDEIITEAGIQKWKDSEDRIRIYFRLEKAGTVDIAIKTKVVSEKISIESNFWWSGEGNYS